MFFSEYQFESTEYFENNYDERRKLLYLNRNADNDLLYDWDAKKAHPLLSSVEYAIRLLENGDEKSVKRAQDILNACVSLQYTYINQSEQNNAPGLFPYYLESIDMSSDSNTISFKIGVQLLFVLKNHNHLLDKSTSKKLYAALRILLFRLSNFTMLVHDNVFIHFVQAYLLLTGGEYLNDDNFFYRGSASFDFLYTNVNYHENFHEYNSFYELSIISEMLSDLKNIMVDQTFVGKIDEMYGLIWKNLSMNYHTQFRMLTGVKSNTSRNVPDWYFLHFLRQATGVDFACGKIPFKTKILSKCPEKYLADFTNPVQEKFMQTLVSRGVTYPHFRPLRIASNHMHPDYAVGSFNREDFFFETTPFFGCFRSDTHGKPFTFTLEVLNAGKLLPLANLHSVQYNGTVIGAINFSCTRGYLNLEKSEKSGIVQANDFKIRFKITGNISKLKANTAGNEITVEYGNTFLNFAIPYINFDDIPVEYKLTRTGDKLYFDAIVGGEKNFDLNLLTMSRAICQFAFQIKKDKTSFADSKCYFYGDKFIGELENDECSLRTETVYKPNQHEYIMTTDTQYIRKVRLEQYLSDAKIQAKQYKFIVQSKSEPDLPILKNHAEFVQELTLLGTIPINMIGVRIQKPLNILLRENFAPEVFKHYSVHILSALFDRVKHENFQFEQIINDNYSDIFHQISYLSDKKRIARLISAAAVRLSDKCIELQASSSVRSTIHDILHLLETNYSDSTLSLTTLSDMTGLSEPYISKQFKAVTGMNYTKYLSKLRVEKAKGMLSDGCPAAQVAEKCGFTNSYTFNRLFKQYTGVTANKWSKV